MSAAFSVVNLAVPNSPRFRRDFILSSHAAAMMGAGGTRDRPHFHRR